MHEENNLARLGEKKQAQLRLNLASEICNNGTTERAATEECRQSEGRRAGECNRDSCEGVNVADRAATVSERANKVRPREIFRRQTSEATGDYVGSWAVEGHVSATMACTQRW